MERLKKYLMYLPLLLLFVGVIYGFLSSAKDTIQQERENMIKLIEINVEAASLQYQHQAEVLRSERTHCAIALEIERELRDLQAANSARRRQLQLLNSNPDPKV